MYLAVVFLFTSCATGVYVTIDELNDGISGQNVICIISTDWDLKGETIRIPKNSTLVFEKGGTIKNGSLIGDNTSIKFDGPFIGEAITIKGCRIIGKKLIRDKDVFISVAHTQKEIQTLFDISGGIKLLFSNGEYKNVEKIVVNNNIEADFGNSTIRLSRDGNHVGECFYMEPWVDKHIDFFRISNLTIVGEQKGFSGATVSRRCIQLFYVSDVAFDNITINRFYGGPSEFREDSRDLLDKTRIGTCAIAIMKYDRCFINHCTVKDVSKEIFWCVPNNDPRNITYFTNNKSTYSSGAGSASFLTLIDGRCIVKNNEVHNYNGSAFNVFCYDSEIDNNSFYDGKRSVAIDLSEGTMYRANNVYIHDNICVNTKGFVSAYGEKIKIKNNQWSSELVHEGRRETIITINTRGERKEGDAYIGSANNPRQNGDSYKIEIVNNIFRNAIIENDVNFRCAYLKGNEIVFCNNIMKGLNAPVVQLVEGNDFTYKGNAITHSRHGYYAELYINRGKNVQVVNNIFSLNKSFNNGIDCTVQFSNAEGSLVYKGNRIDNNAYNDVEGNTYIPCYIQNYSQLKKAEVYINNIRRDLKIDPGLNKDKVQLRTNIRD